VAILSDEQLKKFHSLAMEAGLAALVEVHDEPELERALKIGAKAILVGESLMRGGDIQSKIHELISG
jgi:indole-3-glycerol phosphate synthase